MKFVQIHNGFFLVFDRGEEVISTLVRFEEQEEVHWGVFDSIGMVENVEIGFYDIENRAYVFREEAGPFEVASLKGNIAEVEGEMPLVHAHAALARCDETLETIGGHVRSLRVAATLEMTVWLVTQPLIRSLDEETGLNLIRI